MATAVTLPPPVFKYDPANMPDLEEKIKRWADYDQIPEIELKRRHRRRRRHPGAAAGAARAGAGRIRTTWSWSWTRSRTRGGREPQADGERDAGRAGFEVQVVELDGDKYGVVHPDFHEVEFVKSHLRPGVAGRHVGSGVVSDITKHACFLFDQEHPEQPPRAAGVLHDCQLGAGLWLPDGDHLEGRRQAHLAIAPAERHYRRPQDPVRSPLEYSLGGIGDMCAMFPGFADWYLGEYFGMAKFLWGSWWILEDVKYLMFPYAEEIGKRTPVGHGSAGQDPDAGRPDDDLCARSHRRSRASSTWSRTCWTCRRDHFGRQIANHGSQVPSRHPGPDRAGLAAGQPGSEEGRHRQVLSDREVMEKRVKDTFAEIDPSGAMRRRVLERLQQKLDGWYKARPQFEAVPGRLGQPEGPPGDPDAAG